MKTILSTLALSCLLWAPDTLVAETWECEEPPPKELIESGDFEPPSTVRREAVPMRILDRWGPLDVTAVISCEGRLVSPVFEQDLPPKVLKRLHKILQRWRFDPGKLDDTPVATRYALKISG